MKLATLLLTVACVYGPALRGQDQNLIQPGDILIVKVLPPDGGVVSKIMAVKSDGTIMPPPQEGIMPGESVSVGGLRLGEATHRLERSYDVFLRKKQIVRVIIERGTVAQLLGR